jgi:hypothetical protein
MESPTLSPAMLVADVLALSPLIAPLFVELRVDCLGCSMNRFCTLADLCQHYEMNPETVLTLIRERMVNHASY